MGAKSIIEKKIEELEEEKTKYETSLEECMDSKLYESIMDYSKDLFIIDEKIDLLNDILDELED